MTFLIQTFLNDYIMLPLTITGALSPTVSFVFTFSLMLLLLFIIILLRQKAVLGGKVVGLMIEIQHKERLLKEANDHCQELHDKYVGQIHENNSLESHAETLRHDYKALCEMYASKQNTLNEEIRMNTRLMEERDQARQQVIELGKQNEELVMGNNNLKSLVDNMNAMSGLDKPKKNKHAGTGGNIPLSEQERVKRMEKRYDTAHLPEETDRKPMMSDEANMCPVQTVDIKDADGQGV